MTFVPLQGKIWHFASIEIQKSPPPSKFWPGYLSVYIFMLRHDTVQIVYSGTSIYRSLTIVFPHVLFAIFGPELSSI